MKSSKKTKFVGTGWGWLVDGKIVGSEAFTNKDVATYNYEQEYPKGKAVKVTVSYNPVAKKKKGAK